MDTTQMRNQPKFDVRVDFDSVGPSGNSWFLVARVMVSLRECVSKEAEAEFNDNFKLTKCRSYEEVIDKIKDWVYLFDEAGLYVDERL